MRINKKILNIFKSNVFIGAGALVVTAAVVTTTIISFSSDVITNTATITANIPPTVADTLNISGSYRVYLNGSSTPESTNDVTLSPGDVAVIKATITNNGNKSAWVKDSFTITPTNGSQQASFIVFQGGILTAEYFESYIAGTTSDNTNGPIYLGYDSGATIDNAQFRYTATRVLNGTGENAELETVANAPSTLIADTENGYRDAMFIGSNTYEIAWSFYYNPAATGVVDGDGYSISLDTKALQYRDNNSLMPVVTCDTTDPENPVCTGGFLDVVTSSVGL